MDKHKHKDNRKWKPAFLAYGENNIKYTAYKSDETKELFYSHPTKPFLYDKEGELIGFRGSDKKPHFHAPDKGWNMSDSEFSKIKSVGPIVNKYLGVLGTGPFSEGKEGTMYKLGSYSGVKSTLSKNPQQDIRRNENKNFMDSLMNDLKKTEQPNF